MPSPSSLGSAPLQALARPASPITIIPGVGLHDDISSSGHHHHTSSSSNTIHTSSSSTTTGVASSGSTTTTTGTNTALSSGPSSHHTSFAIRLGDRVSESLHAITETFPRLNLVITLPSPERSLQDAICIDLVDWGARLLYKPLSQRLYLIEVYDFSLVRYAIRGHVLSTTTSSASSSSASTTSSRISGSKSPPIATTTTTTTTARFDVVAALGPTFPGRVILDAAPVVAVAVSADSSSSSSSSSTSSISNKACYLTSYDGASFLYTIPTSFATSVRSNSTSTSNTTTSTSTVSKALRPEVNLPLVFDDGTCPELARLYLYPSDIHIDDLQHTASTTSTSSSSSSSSSSTSSAATTMPYDDYLPVDMAVILRPPPALLLHHHQQDHSPTSDTCITTSSNINPSTIGNGASTNGHGSSNYAHGSSTTTTYEAMNGNNSTSSPSPSPSSNNALSPILIVNLDGPEADRAVLRINSSGVQDVISALGDPSSAMILPPVPPTSTSTSGGSSSGGAIAIPQSYVYEYRHRGMEFHFNSMTHELFRVVLHTNMTNTPDFGRFDRCAFRIYNTYPSNGLPTSTSTTSSSGADRSPTDGVYFADALRSSASSSTAPKQATSDGISAPPMIIGRFASSTSSSTTTAVANNSSISNGDVTTLQPGTSSNTSTSTDTTSDGFATIIDGSPRLNRLVSDNNGVFIDSLSTSAFTYTVIRDEWGFGSTSSSSAGTSANASGSNSTTTTATTSTTTNAYNSSNTVQLRAPPGCPLPPTSAGAVMEARMLLEGSASGHLAAVSII